MIETKRCLECGGKINIKEEHCVQLSTYNRYTGERKLKDDHNYFHFQCFVDYWNSRVENKVRKQLQFMLDKTMQFANSPEIRSYLSVLENILNEKVVPKEKVLEKLKKHGRNKKAKSKVRKM